MIPPLFPHQEAAAIRIAHGDPVYLGFDMGIGKSRTFIEAANRRGAKRILILCPASARLVWRREIQLWAEGSTAVVAESTEQLNSNARFIIITHGLLSQRAGAIAEALVACKPFDMTALDEAHGFNAADTLRLSALRRAAWRLGYIIPLSGTPIRNHAGDLYNMLAICWPEGLKLTSGRAMTRFDFETQFCRVVLKRFNNRQVRVIEGSKNVDLLRARIAPFMIRVRKEDVLKDLPPILWDRITVPLSDDVPIDPAVVKDLSDALGVALMEGAGAELLTSLASEPHIMKLRRLLGLAKLRGACAYLVDMLDTLPEDRKVLVFGVHTDVIKVLVEHLGEYDPAVIVGASSAKDRDTAIDKFLTKKSCRVFIGNIQAAGTALTLVGPTCKCSDVVFVESSWTSADNAQAACRVHRIGQQDGVVARMLMADQHVDILIHSILARKAQEFSMLFDIGKGEAK